LAHRAEVAQHRDAFDQSIGVEVVETEGRYDDGGLAGLQRDLDARGKRRDRIVEIVAVDAPNALRRRGRGRGSVRTTAEVAEHGNAKHGIVDRPRGRVERREVAGQVNVGATVVRHASNLHEMISQLLSYVSAATER